MKAEAKSLFDKEGFELSWVDGTILIGDEWR